jgi:trimethylamine monooxygenase
MFDTQAQWTVKYLLGKIELPNMSNMILDWNNWSQNCQLIRNVHDVIDFQTNYVLDLADNAGIGKNYDVSELFHTWANDKAEQLVTFRDQAFKSKWTGMTGSKMDQTFMQCLEDPLNHF